MDTRKEFLKKAMLLSGSTGLAYAFPMSLQKALAINPQLGSTFEDAEHVVILMQENRSFDHCFGSLQGVRGFNDPRVITLPNKNLIWMQSNKNGETFLPFRFDIQNTKVTWMGDIPHSRSSQVDAFNQGKCDQWIDSKRSNNKEYAEMPLTMGYYTREDLPFHYAMADAFTICDQHFSSAMTSTWPNRLYLWSGTISEKKNGGAKAYVRNDIPYGEARWQTFPELLEDNNIPWKVYQNDLTAGDGYSEEERPLLANFTCNSLEYLAQFNVRFSPRYIQGLRKQIEFLTVENSKLESRLLSLSPQAEMIGKLKSEVVKKKNALKYVRNELLKWSPENFEKLTDKQKSIYRKAFTTNAEDPNYNLLDTLTFEHNGAERQVQVPKGDLLYQFRQDVDSGNLPVVSWLVPPQNFSDHPSAPWYGAWYTSEVIDILTKDPEVWKKTIFILTYDENDGYFDHIPPFTSPDPTNSQTGKCSYSINDLGVDFIRREQELKEGIAETEARNGPIGLGFRVPMIIASPWSRGGKVCSQVFDHTSVIRFLENFLSKKFKKNIVQETISDWRRTVCGDLTSAFSKYDGHKREKLPFISRDPFIEKIYNAKFKANPSNFKKLSPAEIEQIYLNPSASHLMPQQEPGNRPSCSLPYQLYADGKLSADKKNFAVVMRAGKDVFGNHSAGSPFIIYAPGKFVTKAKANPDLLSYEVSCSRNFAVNAGDTLEESWSLQGFEGGNYHLRIYGPNGFFREFLGNKYDPPLDIDFEYERSRFLKNRLTGNIKLKISNLSTDQSYRIKISDLAYRKQPIIVEVKKNNTETILLNLKESYGWYDFAVYIKNQNDFTKRFAGRVETGSESYTDPVIGDR